jgi:hypothetical protein
LWLIFKNFFHSAIDKSVILLEKGYFIPKKHYLIGIKYPYETLPEKLLKNERLLLFSHSPLLQALPNTILQQQNCISNNNLQMLHKWPIIITHVKTVLQQQYCIGPPCNNNEIPATAITYQPLNNNL